MENWMKLFFLMLVVALFFTGCAGTPLDRLGSCGECLQEIQVMQNDLVVQQNSISSVKGQLGSLRGE